MWGTTGQSKQPGRRAQNALGVLVALLAAIVAVEAAAVFDTGTTAVTLALLALLGGGALATSGWLLARVPAQMRGLAGERRRALDDLLRAEEVERERIATELHDDTIQVITAALVTIDRVTPAIRAGDVGRIAEALPPTRTMLADAVERVRRLTFELHPPLLEAHGLPVALTDLIDRAAREAGLETDVVVEVGRYTFVVEDLAYRIVREAIADARSRGHVTPRGRYPRASRSRARAGVGQRLRAAGAAARRPAARGASPQPRASGRAGAAG
jgi:signal transduction histidine kinase